MDDQPPTEIKVAKERVVVPPFSLPLTPSPRPKESGSHRHRPRASGESASSSTLSQRNTATSSNLREDPRNRFELLHVIGTGGYGSVYRAWDPVKECVVAVKLVSLEDDPDEMEDIYQEIAMMSDVSCPQLVTYHCSYIVGDKLWIVMEFMEGGSLSDVIKVCACFVHVFVYGDESDIISCVEFIRICCQIIPLLTESLRFSFLYCQRESSHIKMK